jgi:hypothetical protein
MRSRRGVPDEPDWKTLPSVTAKKLELSRLSEEEEQHCRRLSTNFSYSYKMAFRYVIFSNITECAGKEFSFDLVHNYSEAGHSVSFVCPVTRERLTTLYLWLGSVVSRRACRLVSYRARLWEQHQRSTLVAALNARPSAGPCLRSCGR